MKAASILARQRRLQGPVPILLAALALAAPAAADRLPVRAAAATEGAGATERTFVVEAAAPARSPTGASRSNTSEAGANDESEDAAHRGWSCLIAMDVEADAAPPRLVFAGHALELHAVSEGRRWIARTPPAFDAGRAFEVVLVVRAAHVADEGAITEATLGPDAIRVERFHAAPTKELVGKANGHLGPDRLDVAPLGFVGLTEHDCTGFSILEVREGSPAARAGLAVGDVVVAVDGEPLPPSNIAPGHAWFEHSHEAVLGRALENAARGGRERIPLEVLRGDAVVALGIEQPFRPERFGVEGENLAAALNAGFPLRGPLGEALHADLVSWARANERDAGGWRGTDAVNPALGALAMLGTGNDEDRAAAKRALDHMLAKHPHPSEMNGLAYWTIGFLGTALCEWHLATGDADVLPWITEAIEWLPTTSHTCKWGMQAFGHGPDGLPYDDKALMAPTAHLLVFEALARRCGVESTVWEHVREYVEHSWSDPGDGGHGAMGYNASYRDKGEFWSRSGLVALAEHLRGDDETGMREPLAAIMEERHAWMFNSHAYGEPGAALGLLSLATVDRDAFERVIAQYRWRFLANWEPGFGLRYTTPHMGAPYMGGESVVNLAYLLLFAVEERTLVVAGRE